MTKRSPYLGPDTYGLENRDLFFGRKGEGKMIASLLAAEPTSILTGASGTGKSSLIRAEIVPTLVEIGWMPIYAHCSDSPVESLSTELLQQAVPRPDAERERLELVMSTSEGEITEGSTISEMIAWYSNLNRDDERREALLRSSYVRLPRHTLTSFMLAGVLAPSRYLVRLSSLADYSSAPPEIHSDDPTLGELFQLLERGESGRKNLVKFLGLEDGNFIEIAEALWFGWAKPLGLLGMVFILDQAEELYTNFGGDHRHSRRWKVRNELFAEFDKFTDLSSRMPVRFNFSLRPEWHVELLSSLCHNAPTDPTATYFLSRFKERNAQEVFRMPPKALGLGATKSAGEFVIRQLSRQSDQGLIDPFILAVTLGKAWDKAAKRSGSRLPQLTKGDLDKIMVDPDSGQRISLEDGAIRHLLADAIDDLPRVQQDDAWNLLEMLFSDDWTRRTLTANELTDWPLRRRKDLRSLILTLEKAGLIRRFRRGRVFVEIRHERISLAFRPQRTGNEETAERQSRSMRERKTLMRAIEWMMAFTSDRFETHMSKSHPEDPLPGWVADALKESADFIEWDQPSARLFLISLMHDQGTSDSADEDYADNLARLRDKVGEFLLLAAKPTEIDVSDLKAKRRSSKCRTDILRGMRIESEVVTALLAMPDLAKDEELRDHLVRIIMTQPALETHDREGAPRWIDQMLTPTVRNH